jgi:Mg2+-importing ATPase
VFDYLTFGALLYLLHANTDRFRTAWFVESVVSAALILLVVRSRRPFFRSKPSRRLLLATLGVVLATVALPYLPFAPILGFTPLPLTYLGVAAVVVALYIASGEVAKHFFYRRFDREPALLGGTQVADDAILAIQRE